MVGVWEVISTQAMMKVCFKPILITFAYNIHAFFSPNNRFVISTICSHLAIIISNLAAYHEIIIILICILFGFCSLWLNCFFFLYTYIRSINALNNVYAIDHNLAEWTYRYKSRRSQPNIIQKYKAKNGKESNLISALTHR